MNKNLFGSNKSKKVSAPVANTVNMAGGKAYSRPAVEDLAQLVLTGTFNGTFYSSEKDQLKTVKELLNKCDPEYVAKLAVYARKHGYMKDTPAFLTAWLSVNAPQLFQKVFTRVIDNPKMIRNFVQIMRSGEVGRKSLGSMPKRLVQNYICGLTSEQLFKADVGNSPSLQDILKMVHPKPTSKEQDAMFSYLLGKGKMDKLDLLPSFVEEYESFKKNPKGTIPKNIPFFMLSSLTLTDKQWSEMAKDMTWQQIRQNLNTLARHSVLSDAKIVDLLASKLKDPDQVRRAKVFPYQVFAAYKNITDDVPVKIKNALQMAAEVAIENVPTLNGKVYVCPDVSGSMTSPVTGSRGSATSKMTCIDIAAIVSSAILRKNPDAVVMPFDTGLHSTKSLDPMDSIMTNANKLAKFGGGGTNCSLPLHKLNVEKAVGDLVFYVSDNMSWADFTNTRYSGATGMAAEWAAFKKRNPKAKLVLLDVAPYVTTQINAGKDVLLIGGFSDQVFTVVADFLENGDGNSWIKKIESVEL